MGDITSQRCIDSVFSVNLLNIIEASHEVFVDQLSDSVIGQTREDSTPNNVAQVFSYFELKHL